MKQREACGCTHNGERWLALCGAHQAELDAHLAREAARHIASATNDFVPTAEYAALAAKHNATSWLEG